MRIFLSSTYWDLITIRAAAIHYLDGLCGSASDATGKIVAMEFFSASDSTCKEECYSELEKCDLVVGIYGQRYGSIDKETGMSMTELEYDYAVQKGIPILAFIQNCARREEREQTLIDGKILKRDVLCATFESQEDFVTKLDEALKKHIGSFDGFAFNSLWSQVNFLKESVAREMAEDAPGSELKLIPYSAGEEIAAIDEIIDLANSLRDFNISIRSQYDEYLDPQYRPNPPVIGWELFYLGIPNSITRIMLAAMFLKLSNMQHRLLTERWSDELRQEVITIRNDYVNMAREARIID